MSYWDYSISKGACESEVRLETLENRMLLSSVVKDGVLTVLGTNRSDSIEVVVDSNSPNQIQVIVNDQSPQLFDTTQFPVTQIVVYGGNGDDAIAITGTSLPANLFGGNGNDQLQGGDGNDSLDGGNGNDQLDGGAGNDQLFGGNGCDQLAGGIGDDTLNGGRGLDQLDGNQGTDVFTSSGDKILDNNGKTQAGSNKTKQTSSKHSNDNLDDFKGENKGKAWAWGKQKDKHR
ncbi:MAG: calcium-binding protein [Bacillota bacterium]